MKKIKALMFVAVLLITAPLFSQNECNGIGQPTRWGRDSRGVQHQLECIDTDGRLAFKGLLGKTIGGRIMAMAPFYSSLNKAITDAIAAGGGIVDATGGSLSDIGSFNNGTNAAVTVLLGARTYYIGTVTMNDSLHIIGMGDADNGTVIQSSDKTKTPFVIPSGAVQNVVLRGFRLYGASGNVSQKGFDIVASVNGGGLWYSRFEDLTLMGFMGNGFNFDGSSGGAPMGVNQFITFSNVKVFRPTGGASAVRLYGSNGQFTFDHQSQFDGQAKGDGTNIEILSSSSTLMPYSITFHDITCQQADLCANISGALSVVFDKPHLENLNSGWLMSLGTGGVNTYNVAIMNGEIQTTGVNSGNGYLLKTTAGDLNSNASFLNNRISTDPDKWFDGFWSNLLALNNQQPDGSRYKSTLPILSELRVGGIGSGSTGGDITASRGAAEGAVYFGTDGTQIYRSGNTFSFGADKTIDVGLMSGVYRIIGQQQGDSATLTGTTNETVLYTLTIPAGTFALNSSMVVNVWGLNGANTGTVRYRVRIGGLSGQLIGDSTAASANANVRMHVVFRNRNSLSSNTFSVEGSFGGTILNSGAGSSSVNTANSQDLVITGQLSNGADTGIVKWAEVLLAK